MVGTAITKPEWLEDGATLPETISAIRKKGKALSNDKIAWEQLKDGWNQTIAAESAVHWLRAEIVGAVCEVFGTERDDCRGVITEFAREVGCSPSMISQYKRAYTAFPKEETRYPQLTMSHHIAAAYTDEPHKWVEKALVENYTVEAMRAAISEERRETAAIPPSTTARDAKTPDEIAEDDVAKHIRSIIHLLSDLRMARIFAKQFAKAARDTGTVKLLLSALSDSPD